MMWRIYPFWVEYREVLRPFSLSYFDRIIKALEPLSKIDRSIKRHAFIRNQASTSFFANLNIQHIVKYCGDDRPVPTASFGLEGRSRDPQDRG